MKNLLPYPLTALLALLVGLCALALGGVTPFGECTLCWQDNGQQVASDFGYVRGVWEGRHTLDWSFACGGSPRSSFHPTFNNLVSPLTWAVAAIPGLSAVTGLSLLFLLQLALLPLGALYYLRKTFPRLPATLGMALALAYAFGGFVLSKYTFLPFLNVAMLFPWYVAALDILLRRGRWVPYCLLLACMLAAGTYFAWMWLLFTAVYAAARTGWKWTSPVRQHTLLLFGAALVALLLSSFSWLPSLFVTVISGRAGEAHFWWNATRAELEPACMATLFSLPCLLAVILVRRPRLSRYALTAFVCALGLLFISATTLWHLSRPWDFAGRFSYMLDFMLICIVAQSVVCRRMRWQPGLPLVTLGAVLLLWGQLWSTTRAHADSYQASTDRVQIAEWAAEQVGQPEGRAKSKGHAAVENLAFFTPFDSLSHFTACITAEQELTLARWGYQQRAAVISTEGGTLASDTLLGMRYILSQGAEGAPYRVEENPYYFGMGLMVPTGLFPLGEADPVARHRELLGKLLGEPPADSSTGGLTYLLHEGRFRYAGNPYERWGGVEKSPPLWKLPAGAVVEGEGTATLYHLPLASLEALKTYGQELPVRCAYAGKRMSITCRSTEERSMLFLPLLWQHGYTATVDGAPAKVKFLDGFVGVEMPQTGEHLVELVYEPLFSIGSFSLSGICLFVALFLFRRHPWGATAHAALRWGNEACRRLLLGVSMVLLLWPLLTLPMGVFWR